MINITNKSECCGCNACGDVCAHDAITFKTDIEGFWYLEADKDKCTDCGLCEKVCPLARSNKKLEVRLGVVNDDYYNASKSRKGTTYKKDIVGNPIEQKYDRSKFPVGTVILKVMRPKVVRTVAGQGNKCEGGRGRSVLKDFPGDAHIKSLQSELYDLLALPEEGMSDLMRNALNYLHKFWEQIFAYRKDGDYTIDNLATERVIRSLTVQRKNSLFFCSTKGALRSAVYNTFIETCKQTGISFRSFFCKYMMEIRKGQTDYENLLPMTICLMN